MFVLEFSLLIDAKSFLGSFKYLNAYETENIYLLIYLSRNL